MRSWNPESFQGEFEEIPDITGGGLLRTRIHEDSRGSFKKIVSIRTGFQVEFGEIFWSVSHPGVLRGMHTGIAGYQGNKLVTVQSGEILDALVDLRPGSELGSTFSVYLGQDSPSLFIPAGVAHGFQVVGDSDATVLYATSNLHVPEFDGGVNPLSCGIHWPLTPSSVSERDLGLPDLFQVVAEGGWPLNNFNRPNSNC